MKKVTVHTLLEMKQRAEKIVALTAYDFPTARILDEVGVDLILIGDSAANVVYGHLTTLSIGMEEMIYHTKAVAKAVKGAFVVSDMPFLSYQPSIEDAIRNGGRFLKAGAEAVKIEGPQFETVEKLVTIGIPVMGHLGLTPQSVHKFGGFSLQAKTKAEGEKLLKDAKNLEASGCFSIVLEKIPASLAAIVTESLKIPVIGIGAGVSCDGQILVLHDILGLFEEFRPKFVKRYAEVGASIRKAVTDYREEVKKGIFPEEKHSFEVKE